VRKAETPALFADLASTEVRAQVTKKTARKAEIQNNF
jgi:hypothetical protein